MRAVTLLAVLLTAPLAFAAPKKGKRPVPKPTAGDAAPAIAADGPDEAVAVSPVPLHGEGDYSGVKPGVAPSADGKKPKRPPPKGTLSWIGFEAKSGNAEIFLQSVAPFEVAQHVDNGALVVDLGGLDKLGQNTWREVDARFFDTPVARITAKHVGAARGKNPHGAGIEVRITFKYAKDAHEGSLRSANEADGMYYQYLTFAGGGGDVPVEKPEK
jgi:hypothetical protein